jgi:hypothetical protein
VGAGLDRFTLGIALASLALVVGLLALALRPNPASQPPDESTPSGVIQSYALALSREDYRTAYGYFSRDAQREVPYERFVGMRESQRGRSVRLLEERIDGETAWVRIRVTYPSGGLLPLLDSGGSSEQTIPLKREDGAWKIAQRPWGLW